jgi:hypothetical protein
MAGGFLLPARGGGVTSRTAPRRAPVQQCIHRLVQCSEENDMTSPHRILIGALALVALACSTPSARAGNGPTYSKQLEQKLTVQAGTSVAVENMVGEVSVTQGGPTFEVHATAVAGGDDQAAARALADTIRLDVRHDGNRVLVHVHYPVDAHDRYRYIPTKPAERNRHGISFLGMHFGTSSSNFEYQGHRVSVYRGKNKGVPLHVDLQIRVPAGTHASIDNRLGRIHAVQVQGDLSLEAASSDIDARQITGTLQTHSGSGDIRIADVKGSVDVHTGSGDVQAHHIQGDVALRTGSGDISGGDMHGQSLKLSTGSGDIMLDDLGGDLKLQSGSGDIGLRGLRTAAQARIESGSGDIHMQGDLSGLKDFDISSGSGDVTLNSTQPPAVHLNIRGSDIEVHWPGLRNVESSRRHYRADVGSATGRGHISTGSGDIMLR